MGMIEGRKQSMKTVQDALTGEKLACLEERALRWVLSKEDHLLQRHYVRRAAVSRCAHNNNGL